MRFAAQTRWIGLSAACALVIAGAGVQAAAAAPPDVQTIIERSIAATQKDWAAYPDYSFDEQDRAANGSRTYAVSMILGSPYRRLIAVNGDPLSERRQKKQGQRMHRAIARRQAEAPEQRTARSAEYTKERRRDEQMMLAITKGFDFTSAGEARMGSHQVYVLKATPKPGYAPPNLETKALTGMQGTLWIDTETYQWVKVEASVIHPVSIVGFLARLEPGTSFELEKIPVAGDLWFPSHFAMKSSAEVLSFIPHKQEAEENYTNYRPAVDVNTTQ